MHSPCPQQVFGVINYFCSLNDNTMKKFLLFITFVGVVAYDLLDELKNCGIRSYASSSYYSLSFNANAYRVKEVNIVSV